MKKIYLSLFILVCLFSAKSFAQCTTPTTAPYYEGFNGISLTNELPACWAASNPSVTCLTFTTGSFSGNKGAGFYYLPSGSNYFYSKAIQLYTGITYSTGCWYEVNSSSTLVWTDISILIGTSQNNTGLVSIATATNLSNPVYTSLTGTFTVPTSGVYYMAIKGTSNGATGSHYLYWDDFMVTIPCTPTLNTPNVTISVNSNTICNGSVITATAMGADTYSWGSGATTFTFSGFPVGSNTLTVVGTSTLTGCSKTATLFLTVNSSPNIFITSNKSSVCLGEGAILNAIGALTYTWSNAAIGTSIIAVPTVPTTYSVIGTASNGCTNTAAQSIGVLPLPVISFTSSAPTATICKGESVIFTTDMGTGITYYWTWLNNATPGNTFSLTPNTTSTISIKASDETCSSQMNYVLFVDDCTGIKKITETISCNIYPNPGNGTYILESINSEIKNVVITDLAGKIVFSESSLNQRISINLTHFPNGMYSVKISSGSVTNHIKIIKQ